MMIFLGQEKDYFLWKKIVPIKNLMIFLTKNNEFYKKSWNSLKESKPQKKISPAALFEVTRGFHTFYKS